MLSFPPANLSLGGFLVFSQILVVICLAIKSSCLSCFASHTLGARFEGEKMGDSFLCCYSSGRVGEGKAALLQVAIRGRPKINRQVFRSVERCKERVNVPFRSTKVSLISVFHLPES